MSGRSVIADCDVRKIIGWTERYSRRVKWTISTVDAPLYTAISPWKQPTNSAVIEIYVV